MTLKTFKVFDAINREGLDNTQWNIYMHLEPVNTGEFYRTNENRTLPAGVWIAVYKKRGDTLCYFRCLKPDLCLDIFEDEELLFFNVSD